MLNQCYVVLILTIFDEFKEIKLQWRDFLIQIDNILSITAKLKLSFGIRLLLIPLSIKYQYFFHRIILHYSLSQYEIQ